MAINTTVIRTASAGQQLFDQPFLSAPTDVRRNGVTVAYTLVLDTDRQPAVRLTVAAALNDVIEMDGSVASPSDTSAGGGGGGGGSYDQPGLPVSRGQKTASGSTSVVLASDQGAVPVIPNIARGAGTVDANTQRVVLASDGPTVTVLSSIDAKTPTLVGGAQPVTGPLTNTQLRASAVPISGALTDAQLRASAVLVNTADEVSAFAALSAVNANLTTGAATANSAVAVALVGQGAGLVSVGAAFVGTLLVQGSIDGTNWTTIGSLSLVATPGAPLSSIINNAGVYTFGCAAFTNIRATLSAYTSGTPFVVIRASKATSIVGLRGPLPAGAAIIGALTANQSVNVAQFGGTTPVTGGTAGLTGVGGPTAHSAASTGNPVRMAGRVNTAVDTTLVAGDVSDLFVSTGGQLVTKDFASAELDWQVIPAAITVTTDVVARAAGGAGVRNYMTGLQVQNTSATATLFSVKDGAATVIFQIGLPASMANPTVINFPTPLRGTAATAMNFACGTAASVLANAQGYQAP